MKIKYWAGLSIITLAVVGVVGCSYNEVVTDVPKPNPLPIAKVKPQLQYKKLQQQKSQVRQQHVQKPRKQWNKPSHPKIITAAEASVQKQNFDRREGNLVEQKPVKWKAVSPRIAPPRRVAQVRRQAQPPKRVARVHRQAQPPKRVARVHRQAQPPKRVARVHRQAQPPKRAARVYRQAQPPQRAARVYRQAQPPKRVARVHRSQQRRPAVKARPSYQQPKKVVYRKPARLIKRKLTSLDRIVLPNDTYQPRRSNQPKASRLTGDFAGNQNTVAFINMMTQRHGFDRRYLNHLFSNTRATSFLKKMAYKDERPKRKRVKSKSRSGSWSRYRSLFLTPKTINKGIAFYRQNRSVFEQAERRYGVPKEYILGIIGVETRYGGNVGQNRAIDALATMGFRNARRGNYFQSELESFLLMSRRTGLNPLKPKASYAGALGLCQFMPSNIKLYGVDMDRKGGCNLWTPADAIGSVANYFSKHGWRTGGDVAVLARTKGRDYKRYKHSYKTVHSLSKMKRAGVSPTGSIGNKVRLLRMSVYGGEEVWLADHNFYVITRYNHSSKYAMAVHQLAQAIKRRIGGTSDNYRTVKL
ncbi:MAG: lytic murein transglycosylase B [Thiotrichaceae bacterium]|nr:lytic murein transglycosylase B [Thiotrichaceae bacterium]